MSGFGSGVGGMVRAGAYMDVQLEMEVLSIGRSAQESFYEDCVMEVCGRFLTFRISLRGGWIWCCAKSLDVIQEWDFLVNVGDCSNGWSTICQLVRALVRHEIKNLDRPIEAGTGPHGFVIG